MPGILAEIAGRIATFLAFDGDDFYNVLCDTDGHLQIDVLESALPDGAATVTNQATIIMAVQSLQNLVGALHDVGLDEIDVNVDSSVLPTDAATETTLDEVSKRLGDETSPASGSANAQIADVVARIGALTTPDAGSTNKLLTDALTALQVIDDLYGALHSVHTDELDVVVESSALPTDAATQTTLALCLTALQLIDNLYGALESVDTDRLIVRGEDQLFSFKGVLFLAVTDTLANDNGFIASPTVDDGEIWKVTNVAVRDTTRATTAHSYLAYHDAVGSWLTQQRAAFGAGEVSDWRGECWLDKDDYIRVSMVGGLTGDTANLWVAGYRMTLEV